MIAVVAIFSIIDNYSWKCSVENAMKKRNDLKIFVLMLEKIAF